MILQYAYEIFSWTAVVRGALMKGLAETSPAFAKVNISGRFARKHYGTYVCCTYQEGVHDIQQRYAGIFHSTIAVLIRRHRYWSDFHGSFKVDTIIWFINKVGVYACAAS